MLKEIVFAHVVLVDSCLFFFADYQEALKLGKVLVAYARVMMIGPGEELARPVSSGDL